MRNLLLFFTCFILFSSAAPASPALLTNAKDVVAVYPNLWPWLRLVLVRNTEDGKKDQLQVHNPKSDTISVILEGDLASEEPNYRPTFDFLTKPHEIYFKGRTGAIIGFFRARCVGPTSDHGGSLLFLDQETLKTTEILPPQFARNIKELQKLDDQTLVFINTEDSFNQGGKLTSLDLNNGETKNLVPGYVRTFLVHKKKIYFEERVGGRAPVYMTSEVKSFDPESGSTKLLTSFEVNANGGMGFTCGNDYYKLGIPKLHVYAEELVINKSSSNGFEMPLRIKIQ